MLKRPGKEKYDYWGDVENYIILLELLFVFRNYHPCCIHYFSGEAVDANIKYDTDKILYQEHMDLMEVRESITVLIVLH